MIFGIYNTCEECPKTGFCLKLEQILNIRNAKFQYDIII